MLTPATWMEVTLRTGPSFKNESSELYIGMNSNYKLILDNELESGAREVGSETCELEIIAFCQHDVMGT